jgi:YspA, cpYpsA-related SLOG family
VAHWRILVTGSRTWDDVRAVEFALLQHARPGDTLIQGDADGLDRTAARLWTAFGPVESYPAADFADPLARNLHMIELGADRCLVFARSWRSGSGHCARHARKAGIDTYDYGVDTRIEARG